MSKSYSGLFKGTSGAGNNVHTSAPILVNGIDYNKASSKSVKTVDSIVLTNDVHSVSVRGMPNSVSQNFKNGILDSERYYDVSGKAFLDIDYTNHGNSKIHPNVPHEHSIHFNENGKMIRDNAPDGGINK